MKTDQELKEQREALFAKFPQATAAARLEYRANPKLRALCSEDQFAFSELVERGLVQLGFAMNGTGGNMAIESR